MKLMYHWRLEQACTINVISRLTKTAHFLGEICFALKMKNKMKKISKDWSLFDEEKRIGKYPKHGNCIEFTPIHNVKNYRWLKSTSVKPNMWGEGLCTLFLQKRKIPSSLGARARRPVRVLKGKQGSGGRPARTQPRSYFLVCSSWNFRGSCGEDNV